MAKLLLIVERARPDLYNYLTWHFSSEKEVQVIVERRGTERRLSVRPHEPERREVDRRRQRSVRRDPLSLKHVIAREEVESSERARPRFRPIRRDWTGRDDERSGGSLVGRSSALAGFARPSR
jgi:hypothetical protein